MKITKKILEKIIKEEITSILLEQDPMGIELGRTDKLAANYTSDRPTEEEFADEPAATYVMQRLDGVVAELHEMIGDLNNRLDKLEQAGIEKQSIATRSPSSTRD